jgi:benzodiazapine receptor
MHSLLSLGLFLLLVTIAAVAGGQFTGGDWYPTMQQPAWNPPAMLMAPVWAVIYVLMAVSAWMVWEARRGLAAPALAWWVVQLLLGICWSWMYFGLHRPGWALGVMSLWLATSVMVFRSFRPIRAEAANLTLPVMAWLAFSWVLNLVQWHLNGGGLRSFF